MMQQTLVFPFFKSVCVKTNSLGLSHEIRDLRVQQHRNHSTLAKETGKNNLSSHNY